MENKKILISLIVFTVLFCISVGSASATDTDNNTNNTTILNTTNVNETTGLADTAQPKYQNNNNNTGQSEYTGPQTNTTKWNYTITGSITASPVIGADGTIYVGSNDGTFYAFNPDGTLKWKYITGDAITSSATIGADGTIYVVSCDTYLYAFNPSTTSNPDGTLKWKYAIGYVAPSKQYSPCITTDGTIIVGGGNACLALTDNGTNATLKWSYTVNTGTYSAPAIDSNGTIYFGSYTSMFYAFNPDGTLKWKYREAIGYGVVVAPVIGPDNTIYAIYGDHIVAFNPEGSVKWTYYITGLISLGSDGTLYVATGNKIYALTDNGTNSFEKWNYTTNGNTVSPITIGADGTLYFGCDDNKIYAINPDGTLKWTYLTDGSVTGVGAINTDGTLYFGTSINNSNEGVSIPMSDGTVFFGTSAGTLYAIKDPVADFTANTTHSNGTVTIQFTDTTTGTPTQWLWDFGDGTNSTEQNPTHTYTTEGTYTVTLTTTLNNGTTLTETKTNYITIAPITADFSTNTTTQGNTPLTIQFIDTSTGNNITSWNWDFGDGTNSTEQNPTHTYNTPGIYTVTLIVTNNYGTDTKIKTNYITVYVAPEANFTINQTTGNVPLTVEFTDTSPGNVVTWNWDFGDGNTSTEQNPTHIYDNPGIYSVTLTITGPRGSDEETKTDIITVNPPIVTSSLNSGTYSTTQTVDLTSTSNYTIYYTKDATDPRTSSTRQEYNGTITINQTTTLRYAAVDTTGNWSPIYLRNYVITTGYGVINNNTTGQSDYISPQNNTVTGTYNLGVLSLGPTSIGSDGTIYVSGYTGTYYYLYALNSNGTLKWKYNVASAIAGAPAIGSDGTIYIGCDNGQVFALTDNGTNATLKWNQTITSSVDVNILDASPVIGADGTIYLSSYNGWYLYALNPTNGTIKWKYFTSNCPTGPVIGTDGTIYITNMFGDLYAVNPDGTLKWHFGAPGETWGPVGIGPDGTIYLGDRSILFSGKHDGRLYALTPDGILKWTYTADGEIWAGISVSSDGTIYFETRDMVRSLYALNPDGTVQWTYKFGSYTNGCIIDAEGTILTMGENGVLYAFNKNGTIKWTYTSGTGSITLVKNGTMYISTDIITKIQDLPIADFTANTTTGEAPLTVQFTDNSIGATSWAWDFNNDGIIDSTLQNPTYTYTTAGTYTVKLTVTYNLNTDEEIKTNYITITGKPDLTPTNIQTPTQPVNGTTYQVNTTINNTGTSNASTFVAKLYDNGSQVGKITVNGLAAGASTTITFNWTPTTTGTHNLVVITDANSQINEKVETNNQITQQTNVSTGIPDLTISNLQLPTNPITGTTYQVNATISNTGTSDASTFTVKLYDNNTQIGKIILNGLKKETNTTITFNWTPNTTGTHNLAIITDANNQITETNETNNQQNPQLITTAPTQTDLTITNIETPNNPTTGTTYPVTVTVTNNGTTDINNTFTVKLYDNNIQIGKIAVNSLAAGASTTITFNWTPTTTGTHNLAAIVDANKQITETNENNNQISTTLTTTTSTQPDLTIYNLELPTNPTVGTTYTINVTLANTGTSDASTFTVKLYDNNIQIQKIAVNSLAAGANTTLTFNWTPTTTGTHNLAAIVDANKQITETNENNNQIVQTITAT